MLEALLIFLVYCVVAAVVYVLTWVFAALGFPPGHIVAALIAAIIVIYGLFVLIGGLPGVGGSPEVD
jgi:hypothetical protein